MADTIDRRTASDRRAARAVREPRPTSGTDPPPNRQIAHSVAGCGYAVAARQRPGSAAGNGSGSAYSRSNQTIAGSSSAPFAIALQPAVEEPDDLVELVDVRPGRARRAASRGPSCRRASGDGARAARLHPERGVHVGVAPAADVQDRRLDGVVVGGQRALPPVRAVGLLAEPFDEPRRRRLEPRRATRSRQSAPRNAGVRRHRVHRDLADRVLGLSSLTVTQPPTVVDVGQVAVVRGHDRHDRARDAAAGASRPGSR